MASAPLRRLTRLEYERSVADVLGVKGAVAAGLAEDERIDGVFASNQSSAVAVVQVRQYLDAAESIAAEVELAPLSSCDRKALGDVRCGRQFVERVGRRLYRRPLVVTEIDRFVPLLEHAVRADGYDSALRLVVQSLLQSPHFLYHLELDADAARGGIARLPAYVLASRLAYFLWSSAPDEALLDAAASGELDGSEGLLRQARRLLGDARAKYGIEAFHRQWLGIGRLEHASRDPKLFPEWNAELRGALEVELARFSDYAIRDRRADLRTLLSAAYSFPSAAQQPVQLPADRTFGILTQPAFLAAHAHSDQTSPILRGRALRERFFCQPLPDPPPDVAAVAPELAPGLTTRERYAMHRTASSACFGCHRLIDDLGFALENYDPIGRYRADESGKAIDATGQLSGTDVDGTLEGARSLAQRMGDSAQVRDCYAQQWFRFALGRSPEAADRCALSRVQDSFTADSSIVELLVSIAQSDAFVQHRRQE